MMSVPIRWALTLIFTRNLALLLLSAVLVGFFCLSQYALALGFVALINPSAASELLNSAPLLLRNINALFLMFAAIIVGELMRYLVARLALKLERHVVDQALELSLASSQGVVPPISAIKGGARALGKLGRRLVKVQEGALVLIFCTLFLTTLFSEHTVYLIPLFASLVLVSVVGSRSSFKNTEVFETGVMKFDEWVRQQSDSTKVRKAGASDASS